MRIVINTPAGNIGRVVTDRLLQAQEEVVIISRNPDKVKRFVERGAHMELGSIDDPDVLDHAMNGADALFWLTPFALDQPDYITWAKQIGQTAANTVHRHGVRRVVLISSVGAQNRSGVGPIGCLPDIEASFNAAAPDVICLRAASFMENFLNHVGTISESSTIYGPIPAHLRHPMVSTQDIAAKAVDMLRSREPLGHRVIGIHGPEDLDMTQAARVISAGIGRIITYVEVSVEQAKQGMKHQGMPDHVVELLGDMYTGFRNGRMKPAEPRSAETTTNTSLLDFSRRVLKQAVDVVGIGRTR